MLSRWPAMSLKAAESSMGHLICEMLPGGFRGDNNVAMPRLDVCKGIIF